MNNLVGGHSLEDEEEHKSSDAEIVQSEDELSMSIHSNISPEEIQQIEQIITPDRLKSKSKSTGKGQNP